MKTLILVLCAFAIGCSKQNSVTSASADAPGMANAKRLSGQGQYPAQKSVVLLRMIKYKFHAGYLCGGVLVSSNTVLTAAHCLEGLGTFGNEAVEVLFDFKSSDLAKRVRVKEIAIHPGYNQGGYPFTYRFSKIAAEVSVTHQRRFDFALLSFEGNLPAGFVPALIDQDPTLDLTGETVIAYGAGASANPIDVKSNADSIRAAPGKLSRGEFIVQSKEFSGEDFYMIEGATNERICNGDSGGPQFLLKAEKPTVVGINSARFSEKELMNKELCGPASLAAKVSSAAPWILETIKRLESK